MNLIQPQGLVGKLRDSLGLHDWLNVLRVILHMQCKIALIERCAAATAAAQGNGRAHIGGRWPLGSDYIYWHQVLLPGLSTVLAWLFKLAF